MTLVSCLMMTYNKAPKSLTLVEEAVECFLRQDWPDKELIIVNDAPGQVLRFNNRYANIHLVNLPRRVHSLGEKVNVAASLAQGEVLFRWDDDDIHLPWRLSLSMARRGEAAYWKPSVSWWNDRGDMKLMAGFMAACCFTRTAFDAIQGCPHIGVGEDQAFESAFLAKNLPVCVGPLLDREAFYLYRWGTGSIHVSGFGEKGYEKTGQLPVARGEFVLQPRWQQDYVDYARQALARPGQNVPTRSRRLLRRVTTQRHA